MLKDLLEHPFFWWPRTLLSYPIEFQHPADLATLVLKQVDTGEAIPIQFSEVMRDAHGVLSATLNFFSDLPSGGHREFVLSAQTAPVAVVPQVKETHEGTTIVLDTGVMRVRIPATQTVRGDAPGPILQVSRGGAWVGSSTLAVEHDTVARITTRAIESGPLFITYQVAYETAGGSAYVANIQANGGQDFIRFQENMEGMVPGVKGTFTSTWDGFNPDYRQAPNHPVALAHKEVPYDEYGWEGINDPFSLTREVLPDGEMPFALGIYQTWTAFRSDPSANFWNKTTNDALGVFIDKPVEWQDHEYASHEESPTLQVRYFHRDGRFTWRWPIVRGSRSTCVAFYDHAKDKTAMHALEAATRGVKQGEFTYKVDLVYTSHAMFLQNRYGTIDLNNVKDWVLEYPDTARKVPAIFTTGMIKDAAELERRIIPAPYLATLAMFGTRENGGTGPIPGRSIVNFSPVPSRQIQLWWIDAFHRLSGTMTVKQRQRLTAIYLFISYISAGEDFMPLIPMLSGHPNFLPDVKGTPAAMAFLYPDHPMASTWSDLWEKSVELNVRYNTRPTVKTWDAGGGRWTENLGTYVWAYLRPTLRTEFLLRKMDGRERFVSAQLASVAEWLVNSLSAPFTGETAEAYKALGFLDYGHEWGAVAPNHAPVRIHPPQGAHSERRIPPRSFWYFGTCLRNYAPMAAEHAMWAARPTNQDMETPVDRFDAWDAMYQQPENTGTKPQLRSRKYTGYGIILRSAVDTPDEVSLHLQQIDEGPNYRWGLAGEGGCGVLYFFAAGKAYSFNGSEDVGDRADQDTDFCTTFGVYKEGRFRSIGMNVLSKPFYNAGVAQFAEIVPRQAPTQYSAPEYLSRSVLLAGHDYFVVTDRVLNPGTIRRLSWFTRRGSELPTIRIVHSDPKVKETQRTDLQTVASVGVWFDGTGDSMAVVSHRKDIEAETTAYGCHVTGAGVEDHVFQSKTSVHYAQAGDLFEGTVGLIRHKGEGAEFALFHGTAIGCGGIVLRTKDTDLGIGGSVVGGQLVRGEYFAPSASSVTITGGGAKSRFYVDGEALPGSVDGGSITVSLPAGRHAWELADALPVPVAPSIVRTENRPGGGRVIAQAVASATSYRFELSKDGGATWQKHRVEDKAETSLTGLPDGAKVHVRVVALNAAHESAASAEYPLYVSRQAPASPDGLRIVLTEGVGTLTWGEVLGASEYVLYARRPGEREFRVLHRGLEREYRDQHAEIQAARQTPNETARAGAKFMVYSVAAVNGNGEGKRSRTVDSDPGSWRNWDPRPGEPFRRLTSFPVDTPPAPGEWPRYYPA